MQVVVECFGSPFVRNCGVVISLMVKPYTLSPEPYKQAT
jgi:hypothetical protein